MYMHIRVFELYGITVYFETSRNEVVYSVYIDCNYCSKATLLVLSE